MMRLVYIIKKLLMFAKIFISKCPINMDNIRAKFHDVKITLSKFIEEGGCKKSPPPAPPPPPPPPAYVFNVKKPIRVKIRGRNLSKSLSCFKPQLKFCSMFGIFDFEVKLGI